MIHRTASALAAIALALGGGFLAGCSHETEAGGQGATPVSRSGARASDLRGKTSCTQVRYVGDSISVGLVSKLQIPEASERLEARLAAVGVKSASIDVSGGRATYEPFMGRPTTLQALPESSAGYPGCYVFAVGTNDAGNIGAGADRPARQRIDAVMKVAGGQPVLWPLLVSSRKGTPYAEANMARYDDELRAATKRYANLRLYDWPAERDPAWVEGDGIHDTRLGSRSRALMDARALAVAFPAGKPANPSRVVGSSEAGASAKNRPVLTKQRGDANPFWAADTAALTHYTSGPKMR